MPLFCRHNRFAQNCPICSREQAGQHGGALPPSRSAGPRGRATGPPRSPGPRPPRRASGRSTALRTRRIAREADDGYRHALAPGLRATADAERLARALALAAERLAAPGPYPALASEPDPDEATWLAFLLVLAGPERRGTLLDGHPAWASGELPGDLEASEQRTVTAYRAWAARAGGPIAAFTGDAAWSPARRFGRVFERLALPGFDREQRFDLLSALGAAGRFPLEADALHLGGEDATTVAAKRALSSGDVLLLERRAVALAGAAEVPLAALDRGLAWWNAPRGSVDLERDAPGLAGARSALGLG